MEQTADARMLPSDWLLLALIFALPLMNPPVRGPAIAADLLFLLLFATLGVEWVAGQRKLQWPSGTSPLLVYAAALAPSLLATTHMDVSLIKLATEFYLVGLALVAAWLLDSEAKLRRAIIVWLAATALVCGVAVLSLIAFATGTGAGLLDYSSFGAGSLPIGGYPRLELTFFNANMACNYLTVSLALLLIGRHRGDIGRALFFMLFAAIVIAAFSTVSPGLGGIALLGGLWVWLMQREGPSLVARLALLGGVGIAALFLVALAVTPVSYTGAPFQIPLPGGLTLYPAGRFLTWTAALQQFFHHPLVGIGIGIDPVDVRYTNPSGGHEQLTDAHNLFLSIAAQSGVAGLAGLGVLLAFVVSQMRRLSRTGPRSICAVVLGVTFFDVFVYQGLGGSFEDTRHIWVLLGLFTAASRLELTRVGENNRTPAVP